MVLNDVRLAWDTGQMTGRLFSIITNGVTTGQLVIKMESLMFEPSTAVSRMPASRVGALLGKRTRKAISKRPKSSRSKVYAPARNIGITA